MSEDGSWDWVWKLALGCLVGWAILKMLWRWLSTTVWHWLTADVGHWFSTDVWDWITGHVVWSALLGLPVVAITVVVVRSRFSMGGYVYIDGGEDFDDEEEFEALTFQMWELEAASPTGFERACADLLLRDGFDLERHSGGAGDLGADVIARDRDGRKVVVQCKRYAKPVGNEEVQRFNGTARPEHGADLPVMVGLNGFTGPARKFAYRHRITLVDREALREWAQGRHLYDVLDDDLAAA
ncbi:restriction endonuclease [Kitasatospora sp. NBC_01287]|uniref:restriction endonuclease n=1 Tax=Kitasatospora sp. NBC_01287 TaxID=2903573 RepID=UPI00225196E5|nr:restriction endonuclease [Kitasatospora sp. NBC_01287]MCX4745954.1 restriction endonuclease [Kitasatospora sp. NBC_01287]